MSRLLTLLLLYRSGYMVGQYISIEKAIADTKDSYYDTLTVADQGWHTEENDSKPFIKYMLVADGTIAKMGAGRKTHYVRSDALK